MSGQGGRHKWDRAAGVAATATGGWNTLIKVILALQYPQSSFVEWNHSEPMTRLRVDGNCSSTPVWLTWRLTCESFNWKKHTRKQDKGQAVASARHEEIYVKYVENAISQCSYHKKPQRGALSWIWRAQLPKTTTLWRPIPRTNRWKSPWFILQVIRNVQYIALIWAGYYTINALK